MKCCKCKLCRQILISDQDELEEQDLGMFH